jgi:hypothetical protein
MKNTNEKPQIREAIGVFFDAEKLEETIAELKAMGFHSESFGILASEFSVREKLSHLYAEVNKDEEDPNSPNKAFVAKDSIGDMPHALFGSLYLIGSAVAGGAVVASAGILGGAVAVAVATVAVFGGVGALLAEIIHESDADYLEEQVDEGHLLLFVRTEDTKQENNAIKIMSKHSAFDPRIHTVPGIAANNA